MTIEMKGISRRKFLQVAGAAIVAVAAIPTLGGTGGRHRGDVKRVRVRPHDAQQELSPAEKAFCRRARFATAADAMRAAAARGVAVVIYTE